MLGSKVTVVSVDSFSIRSIPPVSIVMAIVDWNVSSNEMAFMLSDGTELYATKTENIYTPKFKSFVAFDEIRDMSKADNGTITIVTTDGNSYTVNPSAKATEKGTQVK